MLARVSSGITFDRRHIAPKLLEQLRRKLSFANPEFDQRVRLGLDVRFCPERLCYVEEFGDTVRIPRGAARMLKTLLTEAGDDVLFEDYRVRFGEMIETGGALKLRDYQALANEKFFKARQGYVVLPCGGGKTGTALGVIRDLKEPTLVIVASLDLAAQWRDELAAKVGVTATVVGGGDEEISSVTIGVAQALIRWPEEKLAEFLARFGLLVVDECHHIGAPLIHKIVDKCPAYYRLGLTATPEREDGLTQLLDLYLGEKLLEVKHEELVAKGVLVIPDVRIVPTQYDYPYRGQEDYAKMLEDLAFDGHRNALIVKHIEREALAGNVCLALSGRVDHCELLASMLEERGVHAEPLTSSVKKKRRKELIEEAKSGRLRVLLATSLADEGLDIPLLSRVFLTFPGKAKGRTVQRVGRAMRPHPDKGDSVLFDFADLKVGILRRHHNERRKLYTEVLGIPASKTRTA